MKMKKYKKTKGSGDPSLGGGAGSLSSAIKEPIIYQEDSDFKF